MSGRGHVQGRSMLACRLPPCPMSCRRLSSEGEGVQRQNERGVKATHAWKKSEFGRERDTGSLVRGNTKQTLHILLQYY